MKNFEKKDKKIENIHKFKDDQKSILFSKKYLFKLFF